MFTRLSYNRLCLRVIQVHLSPHLFTFGYQPWYKKQAAYMALLDNLDKDIPGSPVLLTEILSVLRSIDGRLEQQVNEISELEAKVQAISSVLGSASPTGRENIQHSDSGFVKRRKGLLPLSTSFPRQDLAGLASNRTKDIDGRNARDANPELVAQDDYTSHRLLRKEPHPGSLVRSDSNRGAFAESPKAFRDPFIKFGPKRSETWNSLGPLSSSLSAGFDEEIAESHDLSSYTKYPAPEHWIATRTQGRALDVKFGSQEAQYLWRRYVGDSWTIPPDGRIEMTFQQHILERLSEAHAVSLLRPLQEVSSKLECRRPSDRDKRGSFRVKDYDFDPDYEVSVAEYRAEIPIGPIRKHRLQSSSRRGTMEESETGPWKRIM